jgi:hypothetical protein
MTIGVKKKSELIFKGTIAGWNIVPILQWSAYG